MAVLMFKVHNSIVPEQINKLFTKSESTCHYWKRYSSSSNFLVNSTTAEKEKREMLPQLLALKSGMNSLDLLKRIGHLEVLKQS